MAGVVELCVNLFGSVGDFVDGAWIFSKKVVNDVIKSEVSTGVGRFFWRYCHLVRKGDIESFLRCCIIYFKSYAAIVCTICYNQYTHFAAVGL